MHGKSNIKKSGVLVRNAGFRAVTFSCLPELEKRGGSCQRTRPLSVLCVYMHEVPSSVILHC